MSDSKLPSPVCKRILWVIKLCVTFGLGWFLVTHADLSIMGDTLANMPLAVMVAACIFMLLSVTVSTYKWQMLLRLHNVDSSFSKLHRYYFTAVFVNNFLPSSIGGDGYRIYKTFSDTRPPSSSVIAVVMERLTGIVALMTIGYFCSFIVHISHGDIVSETLMSFGTAGIAVALVAGLLFVVLQGYQRLMRWENKPMLLRIVLEHGKDYLRDPAASAKVMLVSFYFHVHNSVAIYLLLRYGAGVEISIPELFVVLTLVNLIAALPISINGLGVVDVTFVVLLAVYGVDKDLALSAMLVGRILLILISLIGAVFYLTERKDLPKEILSPALENPRH